MDRIITERAVIDVTPTGLVLVEIVPGESFESIQAVTEPVLRPASRDRYAALGCLARPMQLVIVTPTQAARDRRKVT